ncbi:MAG: hypothetical protein Q9195_005018 [Heterodermia aff. obscurata]
MPHGIGAMMSLSLMAIPVLLDTTTHAPQLFHQWARMYHYGHQVLPAMAIGTFLLHSYTSVQKRKARKSWAIFTLAGVTTMSMLPFTWIFMVPTNNELFRLREVSQTEPAVRGIVEAKELVVKWSWLHITRTLLPLAGAIIGAVGAFGEEGDKGKGKGKQG